MKGFYLGSSIYLGWSLGANNAANVYGTAVSSGMVRFRTAVLLASIFVVLGAYMEGVHGIRTLSSLTDQNLLTAFISVMSAAITLTIMTYLKLPVSSSQATVGAIIGIGIYNNILNFNSFNKVMICWVGTPIGSFIISIILYYALGFILNHLNLSLVKLDYILRTGLILSGAYGAYALGANNVGSVIGVFADTINLSPRVLALIGASSIMLGIITYSKNVMYTIGKKLVPLSAFPALVAILSEAITVHIYAKVGVPVSTSQAIIGSVLGIGVISGMRTINLKVLFHILSGWAATPLLAGTISLILISLFQIIVQ